MYPIALSYYNTLRNYGGGARPWPSGAFDEESGAHPGTQGPGLAQWGGVGWGGVGWGLYLFFSSVGAGR